MEVNNYINIIIGYLIGINIITISLVWIKAKTDIIKIKDGVMNITFVIFSLLGGFVGILLGSEMLDYKTDSKVFKKIIPMLVFIETCVIIYALSH